MKILMICHRLPFPLTTNAFSFRILNGMKYLSGKYMHDITIVAFKYKDDPEYYAKEYCDEIVTIGQPTSFKKRMVDYAINYIVGMFLGGISMKNIFDYRFSWKMQKKIRELLSIKKFDMIFVDEPAMLPYASDVNLPKILEVWSVSRSYREAYNFEKNIFKNLYLLVSYLKMRKYEKKYEKFSVCITPTEQEWDLLNSYLPNLNISVIPFGVNVDLGYDDFEEDFPSLLFFGSLDYPYNQRSILYLYNEIYPIIKEKIPSIKLYIVGQYPSKEILKLAVEDSVIVTGYVEDVRPYLARASVITLPVHGYGIKTRILEAMAVGKPIVTSSEGIHGINVMPEENIIIADNPEEFARRVIELLNNEQLREKIGANARKLMEEEYSWEKMTDKLNDVFQKVVNKR